MSTPAEAEALLRDWFSPASRERWFDSTPEYDAALRERYEGLYAEAIAGRLAAWERSGRGALALVILLDQIPLNIYRGEARCYASEAQSRAVASRAIERGLQATLSAEERAFLYLPYMHSEDLADQDRSVELYSEPGMEGHLKWARHHREIVRRFGRFPHRNALLGRASTPQERAWLASPEAFNG
jgi:uncharacterized protein (DUF924 family)